MDQLDKNNIYNQLFDFYGSLLTEKQQAYFIAYYEQDYSLSEIATFQNVSRNAVHDQLKTAIERLEMFESHLNLLKQKQKRSALWELYLSTQDAKILLELKEMDENNGTR